MFQQPTLRLSALHLEPRVYMDLSHWNLAPSAIGFSENQDRHMIYVRPDPEDDSELPADLRNCLALARARRAAWLLIDRDGPVHPELPTGLI